MLEEMKYPINEIFRSIQCEGFYAGRAAVFIRFSGCNKKCSFCDTDHTIKSELNLSEITGRMAVVGWKEDDLIVLTGGEPTIHDLKPVCEALIAVNSGVEIAIETNGTNPRTLQRLKTAQLLDWVTISPKDIKDASAIWQNVADEIKVVLDPHNPPVRYIPFLTDLFDEYRCFIQPCSQDYAPAVKYVLEHPQWRLSVQTQKIIGVL
jgi:7-carboxy-7-deazaguanine synthase